MAISFTSEQELAIRTRDRDLLVSAAAGSGKTATLAERILRSLTEGDPPGSLANIVVVTFTNASADDMRKKIGKELAAALEADPTNRHLAREQLLLPSARISTIDALCGRLLRRHAEAVGISPAFRIADPAEDTLLAIRVMEELLDDAFAGEVESVGTEELCELNDTVTSAKAENDLPKVLRSVYEKHILYDVRGPLALRDARDAFLAEVGLPFLETSFGREIAGYYHDMLAPLRDRLAEALCILRAEWSSKTRGRLDFLEAELAMLDEVVPMLASGDGDVGEILKSYRASVGRFTGGGPKTLANKTAGNIHSHVKPALDALCDSYFTYTDGEISALLEGHARCADLLYRLLVAYEERLSAERRRRNVCSFSDVERFCYRLLCDERGEKTPLAEEISAGISQIYIDEFQDVNALQYGIFKALSRGGNLFMVGDLKQSIYGFRHADPTIFATLRREFTHIRADEPLPPPAPATLFFTRNFRCDRPVVDYTNEVCGRLLTMAGGMLDYKSEDDLCFAKSSESGNEPVYTHIFEAVTPKKAREYEMEEEEKCAAEARWVASEIARLLESGVRPDGSRIRPSDITLLFRNRRQMPVFAAALSDIVRVRQEGDGDFFLNPEVLLALSLLYTVDNPRRDIYLAAVLRSPVFGVTMAELVRLRNECRAPTLYDSLIAYTGAHADFEKGKRFLSRLASWRRLAEGETVGELLLTIYREAGLMTIGGEGASRHHDNLYRLYQYARSFEGSSYRGLYNFISYVNAAIERGAQILKPASEGEEEAVRFMTVHGSKGLEFPVCFLCNANATFNSRDTAEPILYDRTYGPCLALLDPERGTTVKNPLRNLAAARLSAAVAEEEIRLLYVALTRAKERLYVTGTVGSLQDKTTEDRVDRFAEFPYSWNVLAQRSLTDWILPLLLKKRDPYLTIHALPELPQVKVSYEALCEGRDKDLLETARQRLLNECYALYERDPAAVLDEGEEAFLTRLLAEYDRLADGSAEAVEHAKEIVFAQEVVPNEAEVSALADELLARFLYVYPDGAESRLPEKLSVSRLYPDVLDGSDSEEAGVPDSLAPFRPVSPAFLTGERENESALAGTATHTFMQFCDLERLAREGAEAELAHLVAQEFLLPEDAARVRLDEIALFTESPLFARLRAATLLRRELRFHALLPAERFTEDEERRRALAGRELLVQGVIDCLLEEGQDYVLIDYKTDRLTEAEKENPALAAKKLTERHALQLTYYAAACERMYGKPPAEVLIYSLPLGDTVKVPL